MSSSERAFARLTPASALRAVEAPEDPTATTATATAAATAAEAATPTLAPPPAITLRALHASYGNVVAVRDVSLDIPAGRVTAIIGPSGCGKSTLLRCLNRLHESVPTAGVRGHVIVGDTDIYTPGHPVLAVRREIGMVFQRPTPFPTLSIRDNVLAGLATGDRRVAAGERAEIVERTLRRVGLWDEVRTRLDGSALTLSGGQQQRLCLARALAPAPRVLLLDEPTASLDPQATLRIEELLYELRGEVTVVIVTHNMQQAARVSDQTVFLLGGEVIEIAPTRRLFMTPADPRTEAYVTGRFG